MSTSHKNTNSYAITPLPRQLQTCTHLYAHPNTFTTQTIHSDTHLPKVTHTKWTRTHIYTQNTHTFIPLHMNTHAQLIHTHTFTAVHTQIIIRKYTWVTYKLTYIHSKRLIRKHNSYTNILSCKFTLSQTHSHKLTTHLHIHPLTLIHPCISGAGGEVTGWLYTGDNLDFSSCTCTIVFKTGGEG